MRNSPFWLSTYTGKRIYPLDLRVEDFCIEDIAHGLSNNCRYTGQCVSFYSVAEHSVRGSRHTNDVVTALEFLLHDAAEAYVNDVVRPVCQILADYRELRDRMQRFINKQVFGLPEEMTSECKEIDNRMLVTEASTMFNHSDDWWNAPIYPDPYANEFCFFKDRPRIDDARGQNDGTAKMIDAQFWHPRMAKRMFLARYTELKADADSLLVSSVS